MGRKSRMKKIRRLVAARIGTPDPEALRAAKEWRRTLLNCSQGFTPQQQQVFAALLDSDTASAREVVVEEAERRQFYTEEARAEWIAWMMTHRQLAGQVIAAPNDELEAMVALDPEINMWEWVPGYNAPADFAADAEVPDDGEES